MASEKLGKDSAEWAMFKDYWRIVQKYYVPEEKGSGYWEDLINEIGEFTQKHKSKFAEGLIFEYVCMLERKYKAMFEKGDINDGHRKDVL